MVYMFAALGVALVILITIIDDVDADYRMSYSVLTGIVLVVTVYMGIGLVARQ